MLERWYPYGKIATMATVGKKRGRPPGKFRNITVVSSFGARRIHIPSTRPAPVVSYPDVDIDDDLPGDLPEISTHSRFGEEILLDSNAYQYVLLLTIATHAGTHKCNTPPQHTQSASPRKICAAQVHSAERQRLTVKRARLCRCAGARWRPHASCSGGGEG